MWPLLDRLDITTNPLANLVFLGGHTFAVRQKRFVFAQIDDHIRAVKPADGAANNIPDAILKLGENQLFLGPAELLHQSLLGILGCNPPEPDRSDFHFDLFANLGVRLNPPSIEYRNLVMRRNDAFGNNQFRKSLDITVFRINRDPQFPGRTDSLFCG